MAETTASRLHVHHDEYELCAYCPKMCRFSCPVAEADTRETVTPWGKMTAPFLAAKGTLPLSVAFETSWACTGCGHCTDYCVHGNDVSSALVAVRAAGVAEGLASPVTDVIAAAYAKSGNPSGRDLGAIVRGKTPAELRDDGASPVLYLPGCEAAAHDPASLTAAIDVLERLGGRGVTVAVDGGCCGAPLYWAGRPDLFDAHAKAFAKKVARRMRLVAADAGCAWALRVLYPRRGIRLKPEVMHVSEWLASFFRERVLKARTRRTGTFLYHDPCMLARELSVTDEPRAILAAVLADGPAEFSWNGKDASCCGGGGLLPRTMPETAARMADRRAEEARDRGAAIVTACPTCRTTLSAHGVEVHDLVSLVARAL